MKKKIVLASILAIVISVVCGVFAACSGEKQKITWDNGGHSTIVVEGYETLPSELEEGTVVTFTVTPEKGWQVSQVMGATEKGGKYSFTVKKKAVTVTVALKEIVKSVEVTKAPTKLSYFAGEKVDKTGMEVTAHYETGRSAVITDYAIAYEKGGEAFALGETKYLVSYSEKTADVNLNEAVVGKITLKLEGGELSAEDYAKLEGLTGFNHDEKKDEITWTFDKEYESDFAVPTPVKVVNGTPFPFKNWTNAPKGIIAKGTKVSVVLTANYEPKLLEIFGIEFYYKNVKEDGADVAVPYLAISGNFDAAESAYLFLYEGNDYVELKGTQIEKKAGTNEFDLEFDLRELTKGGYPAITTTDENGKKVPVYEEDGVTIKREENLVEDLFKGKWMDIKFRAQNGDRIETQEIDLNNYPANFVNLTDSIEAKVGENWYRFGYKTYSPTAGVNHLKLEYLDYTYTGSKTGMTKGSSLKLENREFDVPKAEGEGTEKKILPALVIGVDYTDFTGEATAEQVRQGALAFIRDMERLDVWGTVDLNRSLTVGEPVTNAAGHKVYTCELVLSIEKAELGIVNFFHFADGSNFTNAAIDAEHNTLSTDDANYAYRLRIYSSGDWKNGLVVVEYIDIANDSIKLQNVALEVRDEKPVIVISGVYGVDYKEKCKAILESYVIDGEMSGRIKLSPSVTLNDDGTFEIAADISSFEINGRYYMHLGSSEEPGNFSESVPVVEGKTEITVGNKTYTLSAEWGTRQVVVGDVEA